MKFLVAVTCLLATMTIVRGMDQETIMGKYMEYLMPDVQPCADKFHLSEDETNNIQVASQSMDQTKLGCLKACVMRRIGMLTGDNEFHLEPVYKMIEVVHAGDDAEIQSVKKIADDCLASATGDSDECVVGNNYTDCYVKKLFT
nr:odorant binding protein 8 [Megachile saussurei]